MPSRIEYRPEVLEHLESYLRTCRGPDEPFMRERPGDRRWSLRDVAGEIRARTPVGMRFYRVWAALYDKGKASKDR